MKILNKKELNELKGGAENTNSITEINVETLIKDVNNDNSTALCKCYYNNTGTTNNTNKVNGCKCICG